MYQCKSPFLAASNAPHTRIYAHTHSPPPFPQVLDRCLKRLAIQIKSVDLFRILSEMDIGNETMSTSATKLLGRVMGGVPPNSTLCHHELSKATGQNLHGQMKTTLKVNE